MRAPRHGERRCKDRCSRRTQAASDAALAELSRSTDHDDATAAELDPLATREAHVRAQAAESA